MKIITYNVNGLRAAVGKGLPEWLAQEQPDVLCLQETKLQPEQYPAEAFEALGYKAWLSVHRRRLQRSRNPEPPRTGPCRIWNGNRKIR